MGPGLGLELRLTLLLTLAVPMPYSIPRCVFLSLVEIAGKACACLFAQIDSDAQNMGG